MKPFRIGSFLLLAGGLGLVFAGLSASLGYSLWGMTASAAAIAALLYAGGAWFGATDRGDTSVVLFTHALTVASGVHAGRPIADLYSEVARAPLEDSCRRALAGESTRVASRAHLLAASPVRSSDGVVVYGLLLSGSLAADAPKVTSVS